MREKHWRDARCGVLLFLEQDGARSSIKILVPKLHLGMQRRRLLS